MSTLRFPNYISVGAAIVALGVTAPVQAQLGATVHPADPSQGDVVRQAQGGLVTYRETTDANGIVSRQYVDSTGKVYAVSWHGPAMPNVQALLGRTSRPSRTARTRPSAKPACTRRASRRAISSSRIACACANSAAARGSSAPCRGA